MVKTKKWGASVINPVSTLTLQMTTRPADVTEIAGACQRGDGAGAAPRRCDLAFAAGVAGAGGGVLEDP